MFTVIIFLHILPLTSQSKKPYLCCNIMCKMLFRTEMLMRYESESHIQGEQTKVYS